MSFVRTSDARAGFTLVEVMLSLTIFLIVILAVVSFLTTSVKVNQHLEAQSDSATYANVALSEMRWRLTSSRKLLDVGAGGDDYVALLDLTSAPKPLAGTRLPNIEASSIVAESVGNSILFAEMLEPFTDPQSGRRVDRYQFLYYYLAPRTVIQLGPISEVVELQRWESVEYADFTQIDSLDEETAVQVSAALRGAGIEYVWDVDAPVEGAFSRLGHTGLQKPPEPRHVIAMKKYIPAIEGLGVTEASAGVRALTVARNHYEIATAVPLYAQADDTGFPAGFEVAVTGPTRGRKVNLRLVLASWAGGRMYSRDAQLTVAVSD